MFHIKFYTVYIYRHGCLTPSNQQQYGDLNMKMNWSTDW